MLKENENIKLSFSVNEEFKDDVLGYEIFKDGELIGFTSTNSFVDTESNIGESVNYTVVPYDKKLNIGEEVVVNSLTPSLSVEQESISIKLREEFDPMNLVKALNYNGEDISSNIVINGEVNVNEKGTYPLEYTIEDNGVVVTKTVNVQVVSNYDYLSDTAWTSITTQYGTPRRNSSIKGRVNNEIKTFDKGFGIHANGKITYDLSNVDYDYFEALVGIDMGIESQSNSSVVFKVIADGEVLATTSVIKHADNMVAINVPVKGVQELVIEVSDGGNGNTSDHAVIANPKLTTNNAKPDLTVTDKSYKLGEVVDFNEGISATDIEDGDLTSKIRVIENMVDISVVGKYSVTFEVSDSAGYRVTKEIYINVVPKSNTRPIIYADNITVALGEKYNPYAMVSASDKEDGGITGKIIVVYNYVNVNKEGTYKVGYKVTDSSGNSASCVIKVKVKNFNNGNKVTSTGDVPVIYCNDISIALDTKFNPLEWVAATDKEDGDITNKVMVIYNNVDTSIEGKQADAANRVSNGVPVIKSFPCWINQDYVDAEQKVIDEYKNVDSALYDSYFEKTGAEGNLRAEEPGDTQSMYKELTKVLQEVVTKKDCNVEELMKTANENYQKVLDKLNK